MEKTLGLSKNTAAAFSYMLFFLSGLFFLVLYKDPYVRFHALQSIFLFGILFFLQWLFSLSVILLSLSSLLGLFTFCMWLLLIYKAWQGEAWEVPIIGETAKRLTKAKSL